MNLHKRYPDSIFVGIKEKSVDIYNNPHFPHPSELIEKLEAIFDIFKENSGLYCISYSFYT
jgi:hypothetical protein